MIKSAFSRETTSGGFFIQTYRLIYRNFMDMCSEKKLNSANRISIEPKFNTIIIACLL